MQGSSYGDSHGSRFSGNDVVGNVVVAVDVVACVAVDVQHVIVILSSLGSA